MSFQTHHIDMLESQVNDDENTRTFLNISWDTASKQYVLGLRVYYVKEAKVCETIYLDHQLLSRISQRLPEVCRLLNSFNCHHTRPVKNYQEAYHLCNTSLNAEDRRKWGACEFELEVLLRINFNSNLSLTLFPFILLGGRKGRFINGRAASQGDRSRKFRSSEHTNKSFQTETRLMHLI